MIERDLQPLLIADIRRHDKMLFVSGPRQSGKTTLARMLMGYFPASRYWDYDVPEDRILLIEKPSFYREIDRPRGVRPFVALDEIHKYPQWKNYLKGEYDRSHAEFRFMITGSGRLEVRQKGGDSLAGRYFHYRLFPFTIGELAKLKTSMKDFLRRPDELPGEERGIERLWESLERLSGFPEPYTRGDEGFQRKWALAYRKQLMREDIRDLTGIRQLAQMELLSTLLPGKVGSLLSINSLREDIKAAHESVQSWIGILESLFVVFMLRPWHTHIARSLRKEPKLYLYDWTAVRDPSARFENMVALHLLKAVTAWTESGEGGFGLHFIRDREKNEVDFLITREEQPYLLVETKLSDTEPSQSLRKMMRVLGIPAVQLVNKPGISRRTPGGSEREVLVASASRWLSALPA